MGLLLSVSTNGFLILSTDKSVIAFVPWILLLQGCGCCSNLQEMINDLWGPSGWWSCAYSITKKCTECTSHSLKLCVWECLLFLCPLLPDVSCHTDFCWPVQRFQQVSFPGVGMNAAGWKAASRATVTRVRQSIWLSADLSSHCHLTKSSFTSQSSEQQEKKKEKWTGQELNSRCKTCCPDLPKEREQRGECVWEKVNVANSNDRKERKEVEDSWKEVDYVRGRSQYIRGPFTKVPHAAGLSHGEMLSKFLELWCCSCNVVQTAHNSEQGSVERGWRGYLETLLLWLKWVISPLRNFFDKGISSFCQTQNWVETISSKKGHLVYVY